MSTAAAEGDMGMSEARAVVSRAFVAVRTRVALVATLKEHGPPVLALSGLAVTQPLLDLFGANPEFFVASDMTRSEIVGFGVLAAVLVPVVAMGIVLIARVVAGPKAAAWLGHGVLAVLAFAFGMTVARQLDVERTLFSGLIALAVAALVTALRVGLAGFRQALRYLALAPLAFLALFLFGSEASALLFEGQAAAATDVTVGRPAPVVFVVLDELPVASLMRADGSLDDERFPNLARLADAGTWYRDATSVSPNTPNSVPTILDGDFPPSGGLPTSTDHPESIFTLLGDTYDLDVTETVTELCPSALCVTDIGHSLGDFFDRLGQSLSDASVVYGHASLPRRYREDLPPVDQSWGSFGDDAAATAGSIGDDPADQPVQAGETAAEFLRRQVRERAGQNPDLDGETLRTAIADSSVNDDEDFLFVHEVFPHFPWVRTPTGAIYEGRPGPPGTTDATWGDNEFLVTQGQQRHLLQVGYADAAIGDLIDKLEADGVWDDALVVVTADHGISFSVGQPTRSPTDMNVHEVYNVPLFIKAPHDVGGVVDDAPARTIDIVPTIVDLLDIDSSFTFDGRSLVGDDRATDQPVVFGGGPDEVVGGIDDILAIAERNGARYPTGDGWDAIPATGPYGSLVGESVDDLDVSTAPDDLTWTVDQSDALRRLDLGGGVIPLILTGSIDAEGPDPDAYLVAVNGTVAGVVGFEDEPTTGAYSALLDESVFVDGENSVELLTVSGAASSPTVRSAGSPA